MKPNENELPLPSIPNECEEPISIIRINYDDDGMSNKSLQMKQTVPYENYDPYEHGNKSRAVHRIEATLLLLKYIIGAGMLAVPFSFRSVGYLVGIVGTVLISFLYLHIIHLLLQLEYDLCKRIKVPCLTYIGVVKKTFEYSPAIVRPTKTFFMAMMYFNYCFSNILFNAVCLITMGSSLRDMFDHSDQPDSSSLQYYLTLIIVPLTIICWIPDLKFLVPFSALTSGLTVFNMIIILFTGPDEPQSKPQPLGDLWQLPNFFAIVLGSFSCTGLILPLKNDMSAPKLFTTKLGVLNVSVLLVSVVYSYFGTKAYFKYGDKIKGNVLSNLPGNQFLSNFVYVSYTLAMGITYIYCFYISFDTLWSNYLGAKLKGKRYETMAKYAIKTLISIGTYALAIVIPNFELFATFSGCLGILLDIGLPPVLQIFLLMTEKLTFSKVLIILKNCLIIVIASIMFFTSFYNSVKAIISPYL